VRRREMKQILHIKKHRNTDMESENFPCDIGNSTRKNTNFRAETKFFTSQTLSENPLQGLLVWKAPIQALDEVVQESASTSRWALSEGKRKTGWMEWRQQQEAHFISSIIIEHAKMNPPTREFGENHDENPIRRSPWS